MASARLLLSAAWVVVCAVLCGCLGAAWVFFRDYVVAGEVAPALSMIIDTLQVAIFATGSTSGVALILHFTQQPAAPPRAVVPEVDSAPSAGRAVIAGCALLLCFASTAYLLYAISSFIAAAIRHITAT